MRRTIVIALTALLAFPAIAVGLSRTLHGPAGPGANSIVDITFKYHGGHPKVITRFEFANIPAQCQGFAPTAVSAMFAHHIPVSHAGKFHATQSVNGGRATYKVKGHFSGVHKAVGTLHVVGAVPGCSKADTGLVHWSATPAAPGT